MNSKSKGSDIMPCKHMLVVWQLGSCPMMSSVAQAVYGKSQHSLLLILNLGVSLRKESQWTATIEAVYSYWKFGYSVRYVLFYSMFSLCAVLSAREESRHKWKLVLAGSVSLFSAFVAWNDNYSACILFACNYCGFLENQSFADFKCRTVTSRPPRLFCD